MHRLAAAGFAVLGSVHVSGIDAQEAHPPHHVFELGDFALESGEILRDAHILYATHGELNPDLSNAILLPTAYFGTHHQYDRLIGPGRALDTDEYFIIVAEQFGSGGSSSPSNAEPPQAGARFPIVSIRDNVEAQYRLLTDGLGISELVAVVGFSMGAQQAFQWAVSHPDFMRLIVPIAGMAKTHPHGFVRLESALTLITGDPSMVAGHDTLSSAGKRSWALHWQAWIYSPEWWRRELFKTAEQASVTDVIRAAVSQVPTSRPHDYVLQGRAWQGHDVSETPGFDGDLAGALGAIRARVLYMPGATDMYFPLSDAEFEQQFIPDVSLQPIPSLWGHIAGTGPDEADFTFLSDGISAALAGASG